MPQWTLFVFWGVVAGIAGGAMGIGGGALVVPILVLIFGLNQKSAQGLSLMAMIPMAIVGSLRYYFNPDIEINPRIALFIAAGSIVGVLIGAEIAARLPAAHLRKIFAIFLMLVAVKMFLSNDEGKKNADVSMEENAAQNIH